MNNATHHGPTSSTSTKSCLIMKAQRDEGRVFWIPSERKGFLNEHKVSLVRALRFCRSFDSVWKANFMPHRNHILMEILMECEWNATQHHYTYSWTQLSLKLKWKVSSRKVYSWFISHLSVIITCRTDDTRLKSVVKKKGSITLISACRLRVHTVDAEMDHVLSSYTVSLSSDIQQDKCLRLCISDVVFLWTGVSLDCTLLIFWWLAVNLTVLMWEERSRRRCVSEVQVVQCSLCQRWSAVTTAGSEALCYLCGFS